MLLVVFFAQSVYKLPSRRARRMKCNVGSGLRLQIWMTMCPNLSMNFQRDSSSTCRRLASVVDAIRWDRLIAYYALKYSTRVWNYRQTVEEVCRTMSMFPLWGTLGSHDIGSHPHCCTNFPESRRHPDVHLDWWSHHIALGWVVFNSRVCHLPWCGQQKGTDG